MKQKRQIQSQRELSPYVIRAQLHAFEGELQLHHLVRKPHPRQYWRAAGAQGL